MANFFYKTCKKNENVSFIFKFIPSSYIKNLLEIVVKLKNAGLRLHIQSYCFTCGASALHTELLLLYIQRFYFTYGPSTLFYITSSTSLVH